MSKQYFKVKHNEVAYQCFLDENGEVWYLDEKGNPGTANKHRVTTMEEAKQAAIDILNGHGL